MKRALPAVLFLTTTLVSQASACPTCGIGDKLGFMGPVVYGVFIAAPFLLSYGIYRYIRNINKVE